MSFADLFLKYRLRSEFSTLRHLGDDLSKKGYPLEDSTFSHWQQGNRIPGNRDLLIAVIQLFIERKGILSLREANLFMESAGHGYLTNKERKRLFSGDGSKLTDAPHFSSELLTEPILTERQYNLLLADIKDSHDIIWNLRNQINTCHEKIYEGYPGIAYKNLNKIARLIYELKLDNKQKGINLFAEVNWIKVRCLSDLTKADDFRQAYQEGNQTYEFSKEKSKAELGPAYWVKSAIKRLELVTQDFSGLSRDEIKECLAVAKLAIKHTAKSRVAEVYNEHLELAKIALLLENETLFDSHIGRAFHYSDLLSKEQKYLRVLVHDVRARGYLKFGKNINLALKQVNLAERKQDKRYQAISLYLSNTKLQALRLSNKPKLQARADKIETKLALNAAILENPYQKLRLKKQNLTGL